MAIAKNVFWEKNLNSAKFEEWFQEHLSQNECTANHKGSSGKMEVDSMIAMFERSIEKYRARYINFIADGDSKTYGGIIKAAPYGQDVVINKKECVGHVQKMGTRLRDLVKKTVEEKEVKGKKSRKKLFLEKIN